MARPRSERAHEKVLEAALRLFAERGIEGTSMDAVAEASGVSKATIYNHWRNKDELALEILARLHGLNEEPPADSGDLRADLAAALTLRLSKPRQELHDHMLPYFMAYAARHPVFGQSWRACVMEPPRRRVVRLLQRGIAAGLFPIDLDMDLAAALLIGPMMYSPVLKMLTGRIPPHMPERVVDAYWKAYALKPPKSSPR